MAKVRIPVEQLPPPNKDGDHVLQFRVISEDRNRISAWSNLYVIKSIGQYRPLESDYNLILGEGTVSVTWDTPVVYNTSASLNSASISHNHSINFKDHPSDIFVQWGSGSVMGDFQYHERASDDLTNILIPAGSASARVVGLIATKDVPRLENSETEEEFKERFNQFFGISASAIGAYDLFKIFDTQVVSLT
jgi:hypothetical protein